MILAKSMIYILGIFIMNVLEFHLGCHTHKCLLKIQTTPLTFKAEEKFYNLLWQNHLLMFIRNYNVLK